MAGKRKSKEPIPHNVSDEVLVGPVDEIDPYGILSLERSATQDQIKSAYRKAALRHHPDKAKPDEQNEANKKFQEVATAYAILSDEKRRRRYDVTGNTSESLDDDDFSWTDFFREQSAAMVDGDMIEQIKKEYQGSEEERQDVVQAYQDCEGDMDSLYEMIMCSNAREDDQRFRQYIDDAIKRGDAESFARYTTESKSSKRRRINRAKAEEAEAMELAEQLGIKERLFGKGEDKKSREKNTAKSSDEDMLKALIQQRQKSRSENFLDELEAKYAGGKKSKRRTRDEPPEELFQKNSKKPKNKDR